VGVPTVTVPVGAALAAAAVAAALTDLARVAGSGELAGAAAPRTGTKLVVVEAASSAIDDRSPNRRRVTAAVAQANGVAAGTPPPLGPDPNQLSNTEFRPDTTPAARADVNTGIDSAEAGVVVAAINDSAAKGRG